MKKELEEALSCNLRTERAKLNISREQLAEMADISSKHLAEIENMKVMPSVFIVHKLAKALKVTMHSLVNKNCAQQNINP